MQDSDLDPEQRALQAAYQAYRSAMIAWRSAAKAGHVGTVQQAAERLLHARVRLYRTLVATGWEPPGPVGAQLDRDAALVEANEDFETLLTV